MNPSEIPFVVEFATGEGLERVWSKAVCAVDLSAIGHPQFGQATALSETVLLHSGQLIKAMLFLSFQVQSILQGFL